MKKTVSTIIYAISAIALVALDQVTKILAQGALKGNPNAVIIKNVFELEYLENTGAAFSSFLGKQGFLIILTSLVLLGCIIEFLRIPSAKRFLGLRLSFLLLISGAIGNLIDRARQGYVIDFFYFVPVNFPRFNVADIYVTVSVILLIVLVLWVYKEEETEFLFKFKK